MECEQAVAMSMGIIAIVREVIEGKLGISEVSQETWKELEEKTKSYVSEYINSSDPT